MEREEGGRRRGTWAGAAGRPVDREEGGRRRGTWAGAAGRRVAEDGRGRRGVGTSEEEEALARRLLQGPEEALARRREEERRGAGGARSADPVRGARGRRGWSPAGVGAAASRQRKTTAATASPTACRRGGRRGRSKGAAAYGWGRGVGDLASEGGREATVRGEQAILMAHLPLVRHKYVDSNGAPPPGAPLEFCFTY